MCSRGDTDWPDAHTMWSNACSGHLTLQQKMACRPVLLERLHGKACCSLVNIRSRAHLAQQISILEARVAALAHVGQHSMRSIAQQDSAGPYKRAHPA